MKKCVCDMANISQDRNEDDWATREVDPTLNDPFNATSD